MRLIFVYTRQDATTTPEHFMADGLYHMFRRMVEEKIIDDVWVIIEQCGWWRKIELSENVFWAETTDIHFLPDGIIPDISGDAAIWVRGGFKPTVFYEWCRACDFWLLFYGANTGRERWPFWDIVLDDLSGETRIDINPKSPHYKRLYLDYVKPINPDVFRPLGLERKYDVCIGASHITDKKGQWMAIDGIIECQKRFGRRLKCVMPGAIRRGVQTSGIEAKIKRHGLDVDRPGMVPREHLARILNQSRLFLHCGGGQNDRSLSEAAACGCRIIFTRPDRHSPVIRSVGEVAVHHHDSVALAIHTALSFMPAGNGYHEVLPGKYMERAGIENVILPRMRALFDFLRANPVADRDLLTQLMEDYP